MIEAVIFDFDGLIRDTETYEYHSFVEVYKPYGIELPFEEYCTRIGGYSDTAFDPYDYLQEKLGKVLDRETLRSQRRSAYDRLIQNEMLRPGVEDYLNTAKEMGLKIGLASSAPRNWVLPNLEELGITSYFDSIRVNEDAREVKPDPELYLLVLDYFGIEPKKAIAFEDSPNGAKAAVAANMHCVIVPNLITESLEFPSCDLRLTSMLDMALEEVIMRVG